jgi:hypothetical protein
MNGSQFFPSVIWKESVSRDHAEQLKKLSQELRAIGKQVTFASGDVHYSEISEIDFDVLGYDAVEVTSSSIHSKPIPGAPWIVPNPMRVRATGDRNYVLVTSSAVSGIVKIESRSERGKLNFTYDVSP